MATIPRTSPSVTRRGFLATGLSAGASALAGCAKNRPPNVLFLFPDQMRAQALGVMGNQDAKTPYLDRLASEGLLMRQTFANSPVCCPARAIILTGRYAHRNGMIANDLRLRESEVTMAEVFSAAGYRTGFVGKWHLDGGPRLPGYVPPGPRRQGFEWWAANQCSHRHFDNHYFRDTSTPIQLGKFEAEGWTDLGVEFLEGTREDPRPFFLTVQMGPPHDPYKAPEEYSRIYDPAKLTMRPNWRKKDDRTPGPAEIAEYYAMVTAVDDQVGRILAKLEELGLAENTIVLVSSDHGDMLGSQGFRLKRKPWEESIRVPGILRWPGRVPGGRVSDELFSHVDFAPTLLGLCGLEIPETMQGADLSALFLGKSTQGPEAAFFQIFGPFQGGEVEAGWRGIRTKRHTYARYQDRPWVLYDLEADPYQLNNLVNDPASADLAAELDRKLAAWMEKTGDSWSYNWTHPVEDAGRLYRHQTFYTVDEYLVWAKAHPELDNPPPPAGANRRPAGQPRRRPARRRR